ncbi:tRNA threonylcarbamoyladenosine dehydratase [Marinigracilibium pacificum]|uniref:tRNA threonylcarbamoyladenosine dehydratase n=1 Tax=Marinigracilibium pacificum TaxID=2729599 RepID=A0A848J390_9BACT|nr:tRNA threonylcarbamoyladenosine dehydratase [Marinigracilibium pacificum]NMM50191.1 tRNA threonylcarbamoyladenosine dehydratase [Marinigracilibium pacificum]
MEYNNWLERTELLIGEESIEKLKNSRVLVVGLGGVGSFAAEFLVRAGIGDITIVDGDKFDPTNKNRQLPALDSTIDKSKAQVLGQRLLDINKDLKLNVIEKFLEPEETNAIVRNERFDYIVDCIDSISPKINLIKAAIFSKTKIVSSMGAGGKLDPSKVIAASIWKTRQCNFARQIKKRLKRDDIWKNVRVVYSYEELKRDSLKMTDGTRYKKSFYGTISYMPALFGLHCAAEVIRGLTGVYSIKK